MVPLATVNPTMKKKALVALVDTLCQAFGLEQVHMTVVFRALDDACASVEQYDSERYAVAVDRPLRAAPPAVLAGLLAHEVAHIARDRRKGRWRAVSDFLYHHWAWYERYEERQTDRAVIRRGYGPQLLAFLRYAEREDLRVEDDGLSAAEVHALLGHDKAGG